MPNSTPPVSPSVSREAVQEQDAAARDFTALVVIGPDPEAPDNAEAWLEADDTLIAKVYEAADAERIAKRFNAYTELVERLREAERGMDLAYTALAAGLHDEALLHLGYHGTKTDAILRKLGEL